MSARSPMALPPLPRFSVPDHAGLGEALMHLDAPAAQSLGDQGGGAMLLECRLRMRVEVAPPGRHLVMEGCDAIDDMHGD